ncbi:uncharacterized mitochondrial protein AtMg00810-like [Spinacia oleracea]|uniref:Uncharacterized mitochondrial protein AtMg00810-like n=1 Tax=Spinacia oleracea TaxID=3562 RepID=A0A9R0IWX9_SPIOL|nr:uncharacterized mitochondrial protein AtMg00810-like [Spinacia oleracea]
MALLVSEFAMKDLGHFNYFLGIVVTRHKGGMFLSQRKYAEEIIDRADMSSCKPSFTPVDTKPKVRKDSGAPFDDPSHYRSLAGALQYLTFTRPDISQLCGSTGNPVQHQRTKHIEMDIHFVGKKVARGEVRVLHVPSCYQIADIFTKGLPQMLFEDFRDSLSVRKPPVSTAGEC